ncbi:unnamed protein product [Cladocopium goreaui]|uniref:RING-type domain-containing protein n=1 Tax=Cladocopium goreaui TaxID=2562237 RepID=A0A9P1G6F1_9DINO|nr:unnamed protein product [Cladocopium goreaui]
MAASVSPVPMDQNHLARVQSTEMQSYGRLSWVARASAESLNTHTTSTSGRALHLDEESASSDESEEPGPLRLTHVVSAYVMGWSSAVSQRRTSVHELVQQGMSQAEANAQVVAEHREEVLFDLFSRYLCVLAMLSLLLSATLLGLATWHIEEFIRYHNVACEGSLKLLTKIILGISFFDIVMGTRVCCLEIDESALPRRWRCKDCCVVLLLCVMAVNVWILLWLGTASQQGNVHAGPSQELPSCRDAAPGLWVATVAHGVGLVTYTVYLMVSFVGVGNMLHGLLRRGMLRSRDAAPVGSLEDNTVPAIEIDEDYECPICLEEIDEEAGVMTKDCHHIFHRECLKHWLQVNSTCPLCRLSLARH